MSAVNLTNDGRPKQGPLLTDGSDVYFNGGTNWNPIAMVAPAAGGEARPLNIPGLGSGRLLDLYKGRLLVTGLDANGDWYWWAWHPGGAAERIFASGARGVWLSDSAFAEIGTEELRIRSREKVLRKLSLPKGTGIGWLSWSEQRQVLEVMLADPGKDSASLWEMNGLSGDLRPVHGYPGVLGGAGWAAHADLFVFIGKGTSSRDIWAEYNRSAGPRHLVQLTNGPLDYLWAAPSPDGKQVFALGRQERCELDRYDETTRQFVPDLGGLGGFEVDFSRDGQWIAYTRYADHTLWKARADGTERTQLTFAPLVMNQPHWSPDGTRIAFMGQYPGRASRIYLISADGGNPVEASDLPGDQGVPTWSPDGTRIVYGDWLYRKEGRGMAVRILDLRRHEFALLTRPGGVWTPRWSPHGRFILGITPDSRKLVLYDFRNSQWRDLAEFDSIDDPAWTGDSSTIYFWGRQQAKPGIYRYRLEPGECELVVGLDGFHTTTHAWYGITPDGDPLAARGVEFADVYALRLRQ